MNIIQEAGNLKGKRVLVRIDIDDGDINPFPVKAIKPTLIYLKEAGARIILLGHVGRDKDASAIKLFDILEKELSKYDFKFDFVEDITGEVARSAINKMKDGDAVVLENVRSDEREIADDDGFAKELANLADIYVNDAFAVSHRKHASIVGITKYIQSFAGFGLQEEVRALSQALTPESPSIFIISGAKIETKLPLIEKFIGIYDYVFVGGVLANNFFKAKGFETGVSLVLDENIDISSVINNERVLIPKDVIVFKDGKSSVKKASKVLPEEKIVDAGPESVEVLKEKISNMQCVLWNGPLGEYEIGFDKATKDLARIIAFSSAHTFVGGGDTLSAITDLHLEDKYSFISTGGGAMLEFLLKGTLPGIEALS
ncbi:MAG TPA: phosphoglycerate kinase [Candidatus Kaiserbacteria bacterium]|nr:phosphoglycerate kinase [Candidatus Kaiserbacteria bacterium]